MWQSSALVSPTITLSRDAGPTGDDIEPVGESRADVEMGNEEEESLESEIPLKRTRNCHEKSTTKKPKIVEVLCAGNWCAVCVRGRFVAKHLTMSSLTAFDHVSVTQENADKFPILICQNDEQS